MQIKTVLLWVMAFSLCSACSGAQGQGEATAMPAFVTATLPPTPVPQATRTATLPAPVTSSAAEGSAPSPSEGITTTQINVRAGPYTASAALGLVGPFVKVQVIGKDASGSWYQILFAESAAGQGWARAEFVQVDSPEKIPLTGGASAAGAAVSGLVSQRINVRKGPGTEFELLGELNSNDLVFITGRDAGGTWLQIEYASAADGTGWVTAQFIKTGNIESLPLIGGTQPAATQAAGVSTPTPGANIRTAVQDGDTLQAPQGAAVFSSSASRALQINGEVSAPGDAEDWIQFSSASESLSMEVQCAGGTLDVSLWNNEKPVDGFSLSCGVREPVRVTPHSEYVLRLFQNAPGFTTYTLRVEVIR